MPVLTLYYDGHCHFCLRAVQRLQRWDKRGALAYADIAAPGFDPAPLGVTLEALNTEMHARRADGTLLRGMDSILEAHMLAGRAWLVWPLRIPFLRPLFGAAYRAFARNRYRISRLAGLGVRTPACQSGACSIYLGDDHGT